jgi:putative hemolysin
MAQYALRPERYGGSHDDPTPPGMTLGRKGTMEVRLARNRDDIKACQTLRYRVFYEELSAQPDRQARLNKIDADGFDAICDHLLVIDHDIANADLDGEVDLLPEGGGVVGTYRLLRQDVAERHGGFYTADEFDIQPLLDRKSPGTRFLELGRSCVLKPYRTKPTVELLWQGIWNYVRLHKLDVMLGCASLEGTDPDQLALPLSYLSHNHKAPEEWRVRALPERYVEMNRMAAEEIDLRSAMRALPPLIKGYLRLGAYIGEGAVIDAQFNTIDVLIVMPVDAINERYFSHFGGPDDAVSDKV